jgi:hypothetical protein
MEGMVAPLATVNETNTFVTTVIGIITYTIIAAHRLQASALLRFGVVKLAQNF